MSDADKSNVSMPDPPAPNQGKDEPIATTPTESPQASDDPVEAAPGDSKGVAVPSTHAMAGTSEDGVPIPGIVPPGKPDGEVDTRA
jgi:hypothetical protein